MKTINVFKYGKSYKADSWLEAYEIIHGEIKSIDRLFIYEEIKKYVYMTDLYIDETEDLDERVELFKKYELENGKFNYSIWFDDNGSEYVKIEDDDIESYFKKLCYETPRDVGYVDYER